MHKLIAALATRDPGWYALHRAIRAAVVVPAVFALGSEVIADAQVATFGAFGSFALLLFVDFPGNRSGRLAAYLLLGVAGGALITLGTLVSRPSWLAVVGMGLAAFGILFAGVISSVTAAAGRAALLTFILPVMLSGGAGDIPPRLAGWGIALAVAVPVALFAWPPTQHDRLRLRAADTCTALAAMLHPHQPASGPDPLVQVSSAVTALRTSFRATAFRPVALSTGSRLLMRLVDELEWVSSVVVNACADAPAQWPESGQRLRLAAAEVMLSGARVLSHDGSGPSKDGCERLEDCLARLDACRQDVADRTLEAITTATQGALVGEPAGEQSRLDAVAGEFDRPLYAAHELGYGVHLAGRTVSVIAAADARTWLARLAGRRPTGTAIGELTAAEQITAGHLDSHSVWLQNSLRGAAGLAVAVLIARASGAQHGFWVVLGALSVLRSNALSTGSTVLRALAGTIAGFVIGGALLALIGTSHAVLWPLLPVVVLIAAFAPDAISFAAGQAAFTVVVIILFNIIAPEGWTIGLLRVEDVAFGCAAGLAAGVLFWPRGAGAALGQALGDGYRYAAQYLRAAVDYTASIGPKPQPEHDQARAAGWRLDDALRQYLAERGAKQVPLESVTALANGASRLRLAGEAIVRLHRDPDAHDPVTDELAAPTRVLTEQAADVQSWYAAVADVLSRADERLPTIDSPDPGGEPFLDVLLPAVSTCRDSLQARHAERLLWSGQYLGDVGQLRRELTEPVAEVRSTQRRPWWSK